MARAAQRGRAADYARGRIRAFDTSGSAGQWAVIQAFSRAAGVELNLLDAADIERSATEFARFQNSGVIVAVGSQVMIHRGLIISLAARHRWPTVYPYRSFVTAGGLISYGPDLVSQYRLAPATSIVSSSVKAADLPVQAPTKYELAVNLKTAKALGLTIPPSVLARADEVIE